MTVLKTVETSVPSSVYELRDAALLIWLIEMSKSDYFKGWNTISEWMETVLCHFQNIADGKVSFSTEGKPADKLLKGYIVHHAKYGAGIVEDIISTRTGSNSGDMATVNFDEYGVKKFPIPDSLKFFLVLSEVSTLSSEAIKKTMTCEIYDYEEWLSALTIINKNKEYLGDSLYNAVFELLVEKIGLKAKFVEDRFKEKGWD